MLGSSLQNALRTYMLDSFLQNGLCMFCTVLYKMMQNGCINAGPFSTKWFACMHECSLQNVFNLCMSCVSQMSLQHGLKMF